MCEDHGIMGGQRLELVGRGDEGQAGDASDFFRHLLGKADGCIEARPNGGAALGEFVKAGQGDFNALD